MVGSTGLDVEVVREVALGVEVDRQDVEAGEPEDVGEMADGRRLARAALLGEDCDLVRHAAQVMSTGEAGRCCGARRAPARP